MAHPPHKRMQRGDRLQFILLVILLVVVGVGGILVVTYPKQFGLPGLHPATPAAVEATPAA
ncbi:MAG: hypothetical protein ACR2J8_08630 [Thermomicrobiales bacterium]